MFGSELRAREDDDVTSPLGYQSGQVRSKPKGVGQRTDLHASKSCASGSGPFSPIFLHSLGVRIYGPTIQSEPG